MKVDFIPIPKKAYNKITQICFFYSRLEDQLHLIHERFQELSMKFEMFQQQPSVEYEPRLARVARQLRDIKEKVLIRLISWDSDINCGLTKSLITETWGYCYISNFLSIFRNYFNAFKFWNILKKSPSLSACEKACMIGMIKGTLIRCIL